MSELTKRILSAVLLAALLLGDLWLGSWWYLALLVIGGALVFREYARLVLQMSQTEERRLLWLSFGAIYIAAAGVGLWNVREARDGLIYASWLFIAVWATDVGAYVIGRSLGGPKIAPSISPSKTWAGLAGGIAFSSLAMFGFQRWFDPAVHGLAVATALGLGLIVALLAQGGDFFESWMKRRAGVKDSGRLIPGHGGLFDRVDGLLPVAIVFPYLMGIA